MRDAPRPLTLMREPEKVAPLYPSGRTPTPEEMADHAPWLLDGARRVLETKDALGKGIWYAETLSQYAAFLQAYAVQWKAERESTVKSYSVEETRPAVLKGVEAYRAGYGLDSNPFTERRLRDAWAHGWYTARSRRGGAS